MKTNKGWSVALVLGLWLSTLPPYPLAADDAYEQGRAALDQKQWERAESLFREAAKQGGDRADDAMYWRAYALGKLGRVDQALRAIDELKRTHPDSPWIDDAQELREELRGDNDANADEDSDLKSMALMALVQADPERAIPHLEKYLRSDRPVSDKQQALFMLLQSGSPHATQIVVDIAKDPKREPELRSAAVSSLGVAGGRRNAELLGEIYRSTSDSEVKDAVLNAYLVSGNDDALLDVARNDKDEDLREKAIQNLGAMGARAALDRLGSEAKDSKTREALLNAYMVSGNTAKLLEIARTDRDKDVRQKAIQLLGAARGTEELEELYRSERSEETRSTILQAFMVAGHQGPIVRAAREATEPELREQAIQLLGVMGGMEELSRLYESERSVEIKKQILQAQAVGGGGDKLLRIAKSDPEPELRMAAIQGLGIAGHVSRSDLIELYGQEKAFDVKRAVLQSLFTRGDVKSLVEIARKEADPKLKREAVQLIAVSGKEEGTAYMMELLNEK
jgi:tetratricopeptide (TPR) repeat protein